MLKKESELQVTSLEDLDRVAKDLVTKLTGRDIWLFNGPMGAGKTTLIGKIVAALGGTCANSPTYAIHQEYFCKSIQVDHLDLYRIKSVEEFEGTGLLDLFLRDRGLILIEWAELMPRYIFENQWHLLELRLDFQNSDSPGEERVLQIFG